MHHCGGELIPHVSELEGKGHGRGLGLSRDRGKAEEKRGGRPRRQRGDPGLLEELGHGPPPLPQDRGAVAHPIQLAHRQGSSGAVPEIGVDSRLKAVEEAREGISRVGESARRPSRIIRASLLVDESDQASGVRGRGVARITRRRGEGL